MFFIPVVVLKTGIALGTIFNGRGAAQSADGIALDSFGASGAEAVVVLLDLWTCGPPSAETSHFPPAVREPLCVDLFLP